MQWEPWETSREIASKALLATHITCAHVHRWQEGGAVAAADRRAQLGQGDHARDRPTWLTCQAGLREERHLWWCAAAPLRGSAARPADAAKRRSARSGWMRATAGRRQAQSAPPPPAARLDPIERNSAVSQMAYFVSAQAFSQVSQVRRQFRVISV